MDKGTVIVVCCLVATIVLLAISLYLERSVVNKVFEENHDLKLRLFNLIHEEEVRHERVVTNKASFDERCLYDLVRRVESLEKKLGNCDKKTIDIYQPKKGEK